MTTASTRPPLEIRRTQLSKLMSPHNHRTDRPTYKDAGGMSPYNRRKPRPVSTSTQCRGSHKRQTRSHTTARRFQPGAVVLLQETHRTTDDNLKMPGCLLAGYKPPPFELYPTSLRSVPAPAIYAGDFNCQHTDWGYKQTTKDAERLGIQYRSSATV